MKDGKPYVAFIWRMNELNQSIRIDKLINIYEMQDELNYKFYVGSSLADIPKENFSQFDLIFGHLYPPQNLTDMPHWDVELFTEIMNQ